MSFTSGSWRIHEHNIGLFILVCSFSHELARIGFVETDIFQIICSCVYDCIPHGIAVKFCTDNIACAVFGAGCTGINGFFVAASRLLLAMSRGRILPEWFGRIHPRYHTPYNAILFTAALALLTPFAGRSAVGWTVDMSSVGTGIGYLFTCLVARRAIRQSSGTGRSEGLYC